MDEKKPPPPQTLFGPIQETTHCPACDRKRETVESICACGWEYDLTREGKVPLPRSLVVCPVVLLSVFFSVLALGHWLGQREGARQKEIKDLIVQSFRDFAVDHPTYEQTRTWLASRHSDHKTDVELHPVMIDVTTWLNDRERVNVELWYDRDGRFLRIEFRTF